MVTHDPYQCLGSIWITIHCCVVTTSKHNNKLDQAGAPVCWFMSWVGSLGFMQYFKGRTYGSVWKCGTPHFMAVLTGTYRNKSSLTIIFCFFSQDFQTIQYIYIPIGSMYAIYGNIYHQYTPNVSMYTIHGSVMGYILDYITTGGFILDFFYGD